MISTDTFNALTNELGRMKAERAKTVARLDEEIAALQKALELLSGRPATPALPEPQAKAPEPEGREGEGGGVKGRAGAKSIPGRDAMILAARKAGSSTRELAEKYGVSTERIRQICARKGM